MDGDGARGGLQSGGIFSGDDGGPFAACVHLLRAICCGDQPSQPRPHRLSSSHSHSGASGGRQ